MQVFCKCVDTQSYKYVVKFAACLSDLCQDVVHHSMLLSKVRVIRLRSSCQHSPYTIACFDHESSSLAGVRGFQVAERKALGCRFCSSVHPLDCQSAS